MDNNNLRELLKKAITLETSIVEIDTMIADHDNYIDKFKRDDSCKHEIEDEIEELEDSKKSCGTAPRESSVEYDYKFCDEYKKQLKHINYIKDGSTIIKPLMIRYIICLVLVHSPYLFWNVGGLICVLGCVVLWNVINLYFKAKERRFGVCHFFWIIGYARELIKLSKESKSLPSEEKKLETIVSRLKREKHEQYEADLKDYKKRQEEVKAYNSKIDAEIAKLKRKLAAESENKNKDIKSLAVIKTDLCEKRKSLEDALSVIYRKAGIYPKYHSLVASATISEYFESGRVTELEGPNGAYNLFEMELRQNIIIGQLQAIGNIMELSARRLDQIRSTQYQLCAQLESVNSNLLSMHSSFKTSMKDITDSMKRKTYIDSLNAASLNAVQSNTETIKYLSLFR